MTLLVDGLALGMLWYLVSIGLAITLGLMRFVNLAHGVFAMAGGYACVTLLNGYGLPFFLTLPAAFVAGAALGAVLERTLYRHLYSADPKDQILFTIGLVFIAVAAAHYFWGARQQILHLPEFLSGQVRVLGMELGAYRLFLIAAGLGVALLLQALQARTLWGSRLRAAVDNPRVAGALGIDVARIFAGTFTLGAGLAGLGGALGVEMLGLDPEYPVKYLIYFLVVVALGGRKPILGTLYASLLLGLADVAGKYYFPQAGAFILYTVMILALVLRWQGLGRARVSRSGRA